MLYYCCIILRLISYYKSQSSQNGSRMRVRIQLVIGNSKGALGHVSFSTMLVTRGVSFSFVDRNLLLLIKTLTSTLPIRTISQR